LVRLLESGLVAPQEIVARVGSGGDEVAATVDMRVSLLRAEFVGRSEETGRFQEFLDSHRELQKLGAFIPTRWRVLTLQNLFLVPEFATAVMTY
jgi:hypothetical protein